MAAIGAIACSPSCCGMPPSQPQPAKPPKAFMSGIQPPQPFRPQPHPCGQPQLLQAPQPAQPHAPQPSSPHPVQPHAPHPEQSPRPPQPHAPQPEQSPKPQPLQAPHPPQALQAPQPQAPQPQAPQPQPGHPAQPLKPAQPSWGAIPPMALMSPRPKPGIAAIPKPAQPMFMPPIMPFCAYGFVSWVTSVRTGPYPSSSLRMSRSQWHRSTGYVLCDHLTWSC